MESRAPYTTTSTINHDHKGDAAKLKGKLDHEKKKDLTTNHFNIGGSSANVARSTTQVQHRPMSAFVMREARQTLPQE